MYKKELLEQIEDKRQRLKELKEREMLEDMKRERIYQQQRMKLLKEFYEERRKLERRTPNADKRRVESASSRKDGQSPDWTSLRATNKTARASALESIGPEVNNTKLEAREDELLSRRNILTGLNAASGDLRGTLYP